MGYKKNEPKRNCPNREAIQRLIIEKIIQDEKMVKEDKKEGKKKNIILWERAVLFGALIVVGIWKREKVKEIWTNLS